MAFNIFDRLRPAPPEPEEPTPVPEEPIIPVIVPPTVKPLFLTMPDIVVDHSGANEQTLETLQKFWAFVYGCQPGLITRFEKDDLCS